MRRKFNGIVFNVARNRSCFNVFYTSKTAFFQSIGILKLYTNGFNMEFAKFKQFTNATMVSEKHTLLQNPLKM